MPDICDPGTLAAALKIQSAFKGYQVRKVQKKVPLTPQPSLDFENLTPADFIPSKLPSKRVPPVPQRSATTEIQKHTSKPVSTPVPKPYGVKDSPKSPLPARSSKLKEVPIPSVPPQTKQRQRVPSSSSSNFSEPEKEPERGRQESMKHKFQEAGEIVSRVEPGSQKEKEDATKSKIGGFFSSMFKSKSKQKVTAPSEAKSPDLSVKVFDESGKSEANDKDDQPTEQSLEEPNRNLAQSSLNPEEDPIKKDLIHTVLNAVQENWLNQAPKPTLDKVAALQVADSDPELENSERSTSEADYKKKKTAAQQGGVANSDDEGAQLWKQESADGDLPYVETTLPQERSGVVSITPSSMRISQVKLTGTERPKISSQRRPGTLSQFVKTKDGDSQKDPLTVKLPRQDSKTKLKGKTQPSQQSWDNFSAAGLQTQKQSTKTKTRREPPTSMPLPKSGGQAQGKAKSWVDCESLPEKKKQPKKFAATSEPVKSPTDSGRSGMQTPTGRQIVSPEECSCDCHHTSPPHSHSHSGPSTANTRKVTPTAPKKSDLATKGAVPKSSAKRVGGPPTPPIRTTSVQKPTKIR